MSRPGGTFLDRAVRAGLIAYGVVHLTVGWLAAQLALGDKQEDASNTGAMHVLAEQPLGEVLVLAVAAGMFVLVVWQGLELVAGHRDEREAATRWRKRAVSLFKALVFAVLGWSALKVVAGEGSRGGTDSLTARLMGLTGGQVIVGAVGLAIIAYGVSLVVRGWTEKFTEHLDGEGESGTSGTAYVLIGKVGYIAKGIAIDIVGGLFVYAAISHRARESGGLDQALQTVLGYPFGQVLLLGIAVGITCYGLFCFARARHLSR